jgi:DNA repair exonuclease SbcCD ATPase subunit
MITDAKREAIHRKIDLFLHELGNGKADALKRYLYDIIDTVVDEAQELQKRKAESSDLRELIIEVREGFKRMDTRFEDLLRYIDKRFEQIDKRFEDLLHYMEKRFEQIDKRFEQIDKRFEMVEKRFEQVDKRFESIDARFNRLYQFLMWMMGLIFTGFLGLYLKLFFLK